MADSVEPGAERLSQHPDVVALQRRYGGAFTSRGTAVGEGVLALAATWVAIAPFVVGFAVNSLPMAINDVIVGLLVVALGMRLAGTVQRNGMGWMSVPLGAWMIISPFIVTTAVLTPGLVWSNVVGGAVVVLAGIAVTTGTAVSVSASEKPTEK